VTTLAALLIDRCGLSQREAADVLGVSINTVKSWMAGRASPRHGVIAELRALYARIERAAAEASIAIAAAAEDVAVELGYAADDVEARRLGWPCCGAQRAMLGLVAACTGRTVRLVPRGSTVATAAAAAEHGH
jgi:hypothetical protein